MYLAGVDLLEKRKWRTAIAQVLSISHYPDPILVRITFHFIRKEIHRFPDDDDDDEMRSPEQS